MHNEDFYDGDVGEALDAKNPHWEVAEKFGVSEAVALRIWEWKEKEVEKVNVWELLLQFVSKLLCFLLEKGANVKVRLYALAFAFGLDQLNGLKSQAECAEMLGVTRALISHEVCKISDMLGIENFTFRKSKVSREKYAENARKTADIRQAYARIKKRGKNLKMKSSVTSCDVAGVCGGTAGGASLEVAKSVRSKSTGGDAPPSVRKKKNKNL